MKKVVYGCGMAKQLLIHIPRMITFLSCGFFVLNQQAKNNKLFVMILLIIIVSTIIFEITNLIQSSRSWNKIKENELKLSLFALESQIDSHFWHNMLGMISLEAQLKNSNKITKICTELSNMMAFTSSLGDRSCTLQEEILHAQNYLDIMKMRYEEDFQYQIVIPEEMQQLRVPKLIVQPICENAFRHAFIGKEAVRKIHIECKKTEKEWFVIISDNGIGINEDILRSVNCMKKNITVNNLMMHIEKLSFGGLSFPNVYIRLLLTYNDKSIFEVKNTVDGACIILGGQLSE